MDEKASKYPKMYKKLIADEDCTIFNLAQQTPE